VLGVLFAFVVVDLVALSTGTASPQPPLVLSIGWRDVSAAGFAYFALAGLLLAALTSGAFRATAADENRRRSP
jgi:Na+(H+)/acetate symporter ActP